MFIKDYLIAEAERICDRPLPELPTLASLEEWKQDRLQKFKEANGIAYYFSMARTPLNTNVTSVLNRDGYTIETLYFESLPGLFVAANLYVPKQTGGSAPAILYLNGHTSKQKVHYQSHAQQLVRLGFVVLVIDTIQLGENFGYHHGTFRYGWFHWISKGYTPVGTEVWNGIRAIDLLCERAEVDKERIGVTGNSGGGSISWWLGCCDDRIKTLVPSCGTGELSSHIREDTIDTHCDCFFPNNPQGWSMSEMYALVAPKPVLIAAAAQDMYFTATSIREVYAKLLQLYRGFGAQEHVGLAQFDGPHGYDTANRMAIAAWFLKYLAGRAMTRRDEAVFNEDMPIEANETLAAFKGIVPANDESSTVQDWFIPKPDLSLVTTKEHLTRNKDRLIQNLKADTFSFFPDCVEEPVYDVVHRWQDGGSQYTQFMFQAEANVKLKGILSGKLESNRTGKMPTAICLQGSAHYSGTGPMRIVSGLSSSWLKARLDPRTTGNTAYAGQLGIHLRRASMILGRTIPGMMVWDILQGIKVLRAMPDVDPNRLVLVAQREMAVVALYAALLDGRISALVLEEPIGTLNTPDEESSVPIELINALRYTDLPHTAAMLYPMPLIFVQQRPESYRFTEKQYRQLGAPGGTWRVSDPTKIMEQLFH